MAKYVIYSSDMDTIAISEELVKEKTFDPAEFFLTDSSPPQRAGEIVIEGDDHLLDDYFSVRA